MRVADRLAMGFSVLLENINIMLSHIEPEWYAKHFCFRGAYMHGNKYISIDRVDTEDFAWLLFEYGAHAPLIEVLAGLLNVLNSTGKGGVTTVALYTSKSMYSSYTTLFRDTVSRAYEGFIRVRERAQRTRKIEGVVHVPLTAGLVVDHESQPGSHSIKSRVLRSVLEGIKAPLGSSISESAVDGVSHEDPFGLDRSLSEFMKCRESGSTGKTGRSSVHRSYQKGFPLKPMTSTNVTLVPLEKRVLFDSPWPSDLSAL